MTAQRIPQPAADCLPAPDMLQRSDETAEDDHSEAASVMAIAASLDAQGKYDEAEPLYYRALELFRRARRRSDIAITLNNLAALYQARGDAAKPERLYCRALAIKERVFGPNHPQVATTLNNLAVFYKAVGRYGDAAPLYERALRILQTALGPAHASVATCAYNNDEFLKMQAAAVAERSASIERDREEMAKTEPPAIRRGYACFRLAVRPSGIHRWGVYAQEQIPSGRKVIEYTGKRISRREMKRRTASGTLVYVFFLDRHWGLDGAVGGSGAEYINHSCEPNLYSKLVRGHLLYTSRRAIDPGEELTIDYRFSKSADRTLCFCGALGCRGTINLYGR